MLTPADRAALAQFTEETATRLERIEATLKLLLETRPVNPDLVHGLFRDTHSLKGAANLLELTAIEKMAHALENILDRVRSGQAMPDHTLVTVLRTGYTRIGQLIKHPHLNRLVDIDREIATLRRHLEPRTSHGH